jgi:hypothetical protein
VSYTEPTSSDLIARYSAFAAVSTDTINYWLTDAHRFVDQSWLEGDYAPALIAAACHEMIGHSVAGISDGDLKALLASGVTEFQSGGREGFRVSFSPDAIKQALSSEYDATVPGQEYLRLLARSKSGPRVTSPGHIIPSWPCGAGGWGGPFPPYGLC